VEVEDASPPRRPPRDFFYSSSDGLTLYARDYGDPIAPWLPVICLPGLTRNSRDFEDLAVYLSTHRHRPRRVVCFDYRGRGRSAYDRDVNNYNPLTEMNDVLDGMAALGIPRAVVVGTSRGGIIAMLMAVARPASLAGVVLNDIGAVIEARGLVRIKSYVGRIPQPNDWADALGILRRLHGPSFPGLSSDDWDAFVRATFRDEAGSPVVDYDPAIAETLAGIEFDKPAPSLWNEFRALHAVPVFAIHGANSDLLTGETLAAMAADHPRFDSLTVPGQGHPPLLRQPQYLQRISAFITGVEGAGPPADAIVPREHVALDLDAIRNGEPA
jgi:pimeloyl-ACP methyl ester carboxylesterase